jgi:ATP-dependent Lon protease
MNKKNKNVYSFYFKINSLISHIDNLINNKFIKQDIYINNMNSLNEIFLKIKNYEQLIEKKGIKKITIDSINKEIDKLLEKSCYNVGCINCKIIIDIISPDNNYILKKENKYVEEFNLINNFFIPLCCNKVKITETFLKKNNLDINQIKKSPIVVELIEYSLSNTFIENIEGVSIIIEISDTEIIYINGIFKKDSFNIFKEQLNNMKSSKIVDELEYINIPSDFKEKYINQLSIKDYIILSPSEICNNIKNDYNEFLNYKKKSLAVLIKEFIKLDIKKQRKIILLYLMSDEESQFTAHIIFDLIREQEILYEDEKLIDTIFNSFHWKLQKLFITSESNFENQKRKLENISVNSISYESRILSLKIDNFIKSKAMEKLKEISGSKESSIKAQQWLDGFLKIPFGINKKEYIIDFFKNYQIKLENYIEVLTLKISDFEQSYLDENNNKVYSIILEIIDEYHSSLYLKSENSYNEYIEYLKNIITSLLKNNFIDEIIKKEDQEKNKEGNADISKDNKLLIDKLITNNIFPDEDIVESCITKLNYFKKIKKDLEDNNILNKNNLKLIIDKLNNLEKILHIDVVKDKSTFIDELNEKNYNDKFINFFKKNINELYFFIEEWENFKDNKKIYLKKVDKILEDCTFGQNEAKNQMKRIIGQWMNGNLKGQCFGLCGPPGVGKTTLCKNGLAKCLFDENGGYRPFAFLPLGGAANGSILEGLHYTYVGSTWGKIVDILIQTQCMNPIIYIDELDKISKTENGREIISILTHITDQSQNKEFYDRYFSSIPLDLSNVLFIFSYNDRDNIDRILRDRIQEINIKPLFNKEKLIICKNYTCPEILKNIGFSLNEISFDEDALNKIITNYTNEAGMRKLTEILYDIVRDINLKKIEGEEISFPYKITEEYIDIFLSNVPKNNFKKPSSYPKIGLVNGLYATSSGLGGITIIQVVKVDSDKKLSLEKLTGNQGDVMKESMNCALTLAWNLLPEEIKKNIVNTGLHIHCPESATPKDGPSAGLAITTGIISRLINIPIRNDVAMTGEVDLLGNACEIGGLYSKIQGAYYAGIKKVLIPRDNENDLKIIFKKEEEINKLENISKEENIKKEGIFFRNILEIVIVDTIYDILKLSLIENNIEFIRI